MCTTVCEYNSESCNSQANVFSLRLQGICGKSPHAFVILSSQAGGTSGKDGCHGWEHRQEQAEEDVQLDG